MSQPPASTNKTLTDMMQGFKSMLPRPRTGPVTCAECDNEWADCTCDATGITRHLFAFHDHIGGTYKVWTCEDTVFVEREDERGSQSLLFTPSELSRVAQMWLALQEADGTTHEHVFASTLDPRYEACSCGVARQIES